MSVRIIQCSFKTNMSLLKLSSHQIGYSIIMDCVYHFTCHNIVQSLHRFFLFVLTSIQYSICIIQVPYSYKELSLGSPDLPHTLTTSVRPKGPKHFIPCALHFDVPMDFLKAQNSLSKGIVNVLGNGL